MNNWNPYAPDHNPPPGIPKGYPYALNPNPPSVNPLYPASSGYPMNTAGYNSPHNVSPGYPTLGLGSDNAGFMSPASHTTPYPGSNGSPYPGNNTSPYPGSNISPYPSMDSYPAGSPYPAGGASPYPGGGASPYPAGGASPYPGGGASPYPAGGASPYPAGGASPYPAAGASPYPAGGASPYPAGGASPYPPTGTSPYSGGSSPYPAGGASPYSNSPQSRQVHPSQNNSHNMAYYITGSGTVKPYPSFNPKDDAEILRKAMKGFGTDEKAIIQVLSNRSNAQRVYIEVAYKQLYGKDLIEDLKSELSGNFEAVILALMKPTNDYLASEIHKSISGIGTDEDVLIEILCTRNNQEIWAINEAYGRLYGKSLEDDIRSDTSGHFERLLVSCCTGARSEDPADSVRAKETADAIYQAGAGQWGTDESVFNSVLVAESFQQLAHTFYEYQKLTGHTVAEVIESEMSGDLKKGMLAIAKCVENRPFYFAEKLYKAMKVGLGTDDNTLIRIVVSRCEIDMIEIISEYERNYGKPLGDAIADDTSGDYKRVLLALVNPN